MMRRFVLICFILWFTGRYNKYSRVLSQTPWLINNVRHCESSVEVKSDRNRTEGIELPWCTYPQMYGNRKEISNFIHNVEWTNLFASVVGKNM